MSSFMGSGGQSLGDGCGGGSARTPEPRALFWSRMPASRLLSSSLIAGCLCAASLATEARAADIAPAPTGFEMLQSAAAPVVLAAEEVDCMAKVVLHEAGAEPRQGKVAVAQTLVNRRAAGRFRTLNDPR